MQPIKTVRLSARRPRPLWVDFVLGLVTAVAMVVAYWHSVS